MGTDCAAQPDPVGRHALPGPGMLRALEGGGSQENPETLPLQSLQQMGIADE